MAAYYVIVLPPTKYVWSNIHLSIYLISVPSPLYLSAYFSLGVWTHLKHFKFEGCLINYTSELFRVCSSLCTRETHANYVCGSWYQNPYAHEPSLIGLHLRTLALFGYLLHREHYMCETDSSTNKYLWVTEFCITLFLSLRLTLCHASRLLTDSSLKHYLWWLCTTL